MCRMIHCDIILYYIFTCTCNWYTFNTLILTWTFYIITQTLVGASVSKLKSHDDGDIASTAKKLVKKWKGIAKAQGANGGTSKSPANSNNSAKKLASSNKSPSQQLKRMASAGSSELDVEAEWKGLPQLRINICKKLHTIFLMSKDDLSKELNESAVVCCCFPSSFLFYPYSFVIRAF